MSGFLAVGALGRYLAATTTPGGQQKLAEAIELERLGVKLRMVSTDPDPLLARAVRRVSESIRLSRYGVVDSMSLAASMQLEIDHCCYGEDTSKGRHMGCRFCQYEARWPTPS